MNELTQKRDNTLATREDTENLIRASIAPNTMKAYRRALAGIQKYLSDQSLEFSDSALAAYITHLHGQGRAPSSISIVVAAVRWQLRNENKDYDLPITTRTLAGIRRDGRDRGRGQVPGLDWQQQKESVLSLNLKTRLQSYVIVQ